MGMLRCTLGFLIFAILLSLQPVRCYGTLQRAWTPEDLLRIKILADPQISPTGNHILFTEIAIAADDSYQSSLHLIDRTNGAVSLMIPRASQGRWSSDALAFAYVLHESSEAHRLCVYDCETMSFKVLASLYEVSILSIKWSPDRRYIAFSAFPRGPKEEALLLPKTFNQLSYRVDEHGYIGSNRGAIYLWDMEKKEVRKLYSGGAVDDYQFDWNPNSTELVLSHTESSEDWAARSNSVMLRLDLDGKNTPLRGLPKGPKGAVAWSPDGKSIAFLGDLSSCGAWSSSNQRLYITDPEGKTLLEIGAEDDLCLGVLTLSDIRCIESTTLEWSFDSKEIYLAVGSQGEHQIGIASLEDRHIRILSRGDHGLAVGNSDRSGRWLSCIWTDPKSLPEVAVVDKVSSKLEILTGQNSTLMQEVASSIPEEHWLLTSDGTRIHTWILRPAGDRIEKSYPAVLCIHGGPHVQYGKAFFHQMQLLAAHGYVVVYSNPRGSKGYGEAYSTSIKGAWGGKDWEDIQTVLNWMRSDPSINPQRIGVMGSSYGGYLTNWVMTHDQRIRAAISESSISNLVSMCGTSDFALNQDRYWPQGNPWESVESMKELWRQSPLCYLRQVRCPVLILHSEGDLRCPIEQGEQLFTGLRTLGIPSKMIRYPIHTNHSLWSSGLPKYRIHRLQEILKWWAQHLKGEGNPAVDKV